MIPLILVSGNKKEVDRFIEKKRNLLQAIVIKIKPKINEYSIDDIRQIKRELYLYHKQTIIYLFEDFNNSSIPAQNAFLKLLEEPPSNTLFILTTPIIHALLPTIISRSKIIKFAKKSEEKEGKDLLIYQIERIINQQTNKIPFLSFKVNDRQLADEILVKIISFFRKRLSVDTHSINILKESIKVKTLIENNNINPQLAIDHLLIFIYNCYNGYK